MALSLARSLFGMVASTVRAVLPGGGDERRPERPSRPEAAPHEREAHAWLEAAPSAVEQPASNASTVSSDATAHLGEPAFVGVDFVEGSALAVLWRVEPAALRRAQSFASPGASMRLRVSRIDWPSVEEAPRVRHEDHDGIDPQGAIVLGARAPGERLVAAVGLHGRDGSFVAIAHATWGS